MEGESLRAAPDGQEVAVHWNWRWLIWLTVYRSSQTVGPATVRFESNGAPCSATYGPFDPIQLVDGTVRHGPSSAAILAQFDEPSRSWYVLPARRMCPKMVLEPA
jgi:hypothetical protein